MCAALLFCGDPSQSRLFVARLADQTVLEQCWAVCVLGCSMHCMMHYLLGDL
jgi:hypothetical protein